MSQPALKFGSTTICDPSDGSSWYGLSAQNLAEPEHVEYFFPGSAGVVLRPIGYAAGIKEEMIFDGGIIKSSYAALKSTIDNIKSALANTNLQTLTYGFYDTSAYTVQNTRLSIGFGDIERSFNDEWLINFGCKFTVYEQ